MFSRRETEVVIAGAGPVGLVGALTLAEMGVKIAVFDKDWRTAVHSYALVLHPGSLRLLDKFGVAADLLPHGHRIETLRFFDGETEQAAIDFTKVGGDFPFALVLPQSQLEGVLEERLKAKKIRVYWNHRVQSIEEKGGPVSVYVDRLEKESMGYPVARTEWVINRTFQVDCAFVIGADGYYSRMRAILGIDYPEIGAPATYAAFELKTDQSWPGEARVMLDDRSTNVFWPMTGGRCRLGFQVEKEPDTRPDLAALRELAARRMPWFSVPGEEPPWSAVVTFQKRLASAFGRNRIWLAGDAAHLTGPVGVQSMNVGLAEGNALARRIGDVLGGKVPAESLASYDEERRTEWGRLLGTENAYTAGDGASDWVRKHIDTIPSCIPASGEDLDLLLGQIGIG